MLFETYGMIIPEPNTCKNYELFYTFYSLNIKQNLIINHLLKEIKSQLPIISLEIKESINNKLQEINSFFPVIGIQREKSAREVYNISILNNDLHIRDKYFNNDEEEFINYITNFQQVIILYSSFENTIKSWLRERELNRRIFQKKLLEEICNTNNDFQEKFNTLHNKKFTKNDFSLIWEYFTYIRNLYTHSSGIIDNEFINDIQKIHPKIVEMIDRNFDWIERNLSQDNREVLRTDNFTEHDLFIISEIELRFFRNFIIYVWEIIYLLSHDLTKKVNYQDNIEFNLVNNEFEFRHAQSDEESEVLNRMPTFFTSKISNFYISSYMCPYCIKEHILLYKTLYHPNISLQKITNNKKHEDIKMERVFTCPQCKSFFISKYKEKLSDNNGINLLKCTDDDYLIILKKFNNSGTAYIPQENMDNHII